MTFGGAPTRWEPSGESRGVALVAPGRAYSPSAPLLEFTRRALLQHGFTVQQIWWDTTTRRDDDPEQWVRRHVADAHAAEDADRVLLVGKSLGTRAASYAAERGLDAIWLTPLLVDPVVAEGIAANPGTQLLVGGPADELWDAAVARELADAGCTVLEVADADHSMAVPSDAVRTVGIHLEVAQAVEDWLSQA
ncbi:alpha/beta hydrolase [Nocardioides eburneiflavus]|uniref:Alpha/beta hydrolase n=1 Tax=Nocardioides eburneiflavus TaxID=2518372 RepID=A0A4Z1C223_9ACTN|nr:alpha/beta hydrolase [Nocardioides eburneiflavus]TGN62762.1 alpha/beta hydrolase [Nocardioides eburneiflavus]